MDMKRFFLYAIVIAAMALAGCGGNGSGGGGGNGAPVPMGPDPAAQLSALLMALSDAGLTVTADSTAADIMGQLTAMSDSAREAALATIRAALGLTGMEDADDIAMTITERLGPTGPAPTPKTMGVTFGILGLANLETGNPNAPSTYAAIGATTRPGKATDGDMVHVRAGNTANATTAAIGVGTTTELNAGFDTLDILGRTEMMADPDDATQMIPNPDNFMEKADSEASLSKGFTSTTYMRSVTDADDMTMTTTDELAVITDMKDPGPIAFDAYYVTANIGNRDGATAVTAGVATDTDTTNVDETKLHVVLGLATTDDFADLFVAPEFRTTGTGSETITYGPASDTANQHRRKFAGSFNGIAGTFTCGDVTGGAACTATFDAGKLESLSGDWRFAPDNAKSMIPGVDHDGDFLAFGWWLRSSPVSGDDDNPYTVGTFATGSVPYTVAMAQRAEVRGTAKYSGPAGGKFALKTLNSDGSVATLRAGHFTADANLTATFGQTTEQSIAPNQLHSIHGTVTDFEDGYGNNIDSNWSVTLMKAGFGASGDQNPQGSAFTGTEMFGGDTSGNGSWQGRFFGPDTDGADTPMPVKPSGVAGEFTNHWSNGHVIGAFGATQDE